MQEYNMELESISKKFTEETLDTIVRNNGGIRHTSWRFGDGLHIEDTFLSRVCRIIVTGMKEDGSEFDLRMIIKSMPKCLPRRISVRSVDFFRNERNFYEIVLKKFASFQKLRNVANGFDEFPKCYASLSDGENDFIALEDLSFDGYHTIDKTKGLDLKHCKKILAMLGKFHAVSLAIRDQEPDEFDKMVNMVEETYYSEKFKAWYEPYQRNFILATRDAIAREYGGTIYENKMKEFTGSSFYDTMCRLTRETGPLSVICHGDLWTPNLLFKYAANDIEAKVIDFQLARFASLATDISFFIYACTEQETREQHFEELIQIYHRSAIDCLTALGSKVSLFPYSALQEELKHYARFGVGMAMGALSICVSNDEGETPKTKDTKEDEVVPLDQIIFIEPCKTKEGRVRMASTFKHAIDHGFLD